MNIYTEVGLVTLMGLISKHGILIVEVANNLQRAGKSKREAIEEATGIRLRPILMTTAAMVFGVVPLVIASGAGAAGRHAMGLVIFTACRSARSSRCSWCRRCIFSSAPSTARMPRPKPRRRRRRRPSSGSPSRRRDRAGSPFPPGV